jgi:hypothetical protein
MPVTYLGGEGVVEILFTKSIKLLSEFLRRNYSIFNIVLHCFQNYETGTPRHNRESFTYILNFLFVFAVIVLQRLYFACSPHFFNINYRR